LTGIDFWQSELTSSNFQQATIDGVSFAETKLRAARFDGAVIRNASFLKAELNSAVFDGASFCDSVIFSDSDVRDVSFKNVEFPAAAAPVFDHVAWWLIAGFNLRQRTMLEKPTDPEDIPALKQDLEDIDGRIRNERNPRTRAFMVRRAGLTLAIYGARPAEARGAITQAISQLHEQNPPLPPDALDRTTANLHDTEGYIVLHSPPPSRPSPSRPTSGGRRACRKPNGSCPTRSVSTTTARRGSAAPSRCTPWGARRRPTPTSTRRLGSGATCPPRDARAEEPDRRGACTDGSKRSRMRVHSR